MERKEIRLNTKVIRDIIVFLVFATICFALWVYQSKQRNQYADYVAEDTEANQIDITSTTDADDNFIASVLTENEKVLEVYGIPYDVAAECNWVYYTEENGYSALFYYNSRMYSITIDSDGKLTVNAGDKYDY
jgi:cystathionine beta-lyase family protein involved in aluminum resistance